ncbi:MAG: hypothetical protein ACTIJ9_16690 [Aequorivita sp.]
MNLENKIWNKLKSEVKSEAMIELRQEIKDIVKKEVRSLLIEERGLETSLKAYIKSLCYEEVHFLRMLNEGLVKHGEEFIEIPETSKGRVWLRKRSDVDIRNLYEDNRSKGWISCSYENFKYLIEFNEKAKPTAWNEEAKKSFTYKGLFKMYGKAYYFDFKENDEYRKMFLCYLADFFYFKGEFKKYQEIKKSFDKTYTSKK